MVGEDVAFLIDDTPLLSIGLIDRTHLGISLTLYDEAGNLLSEIKQNEWIAGDPLPWDIESDFQKLRLRRAAGEITLEIDARTDPVRLRAILWHNGQRILLSPKGVHFRGERVVALGDVGGVGLRFKLESETKDISLIADPRVGGMIVPGNSVHERLALARAGWRQLVSEREGSLGRNDPCWCGSGSKFKRCHGE